MKCASDHEHAVARLLQARERCEGLWATLDPETVSLFRHIFERVEARGKSVLEVGSGYGFTSVLFALLGAREVHGMELVPTAVEASERLKKQVDARLPVFFCRSDAARSFPFKDETFDVVLIVEVISHIVTDDLRGLLGEIVRVLRPGGLIYLSDGNNARSWKRRRENFEIWRRFELGPPTVGAETVHTHRIAKPYLEIRRDIAKAAEPSLSEEAAMNIAARTFCLDETRVREAAHDFVRSGTLPNSPFRDKVCPVNPVTRTFIEQLVDPMLVRRHLRELGCDLVRCAPRRRLPFCGLLSKVPRLTLLLSNGFVVFARKQPRQKAAMRLRL